MTPITWCYQWWHIMLIIYIGYTSKWDKQLFMDNLFFLSSYLPLCHDAKWQWCNGTSDASNIILIVYVGHTSKSDMCFSIDNLSDSANAGNYAVMPKIVMLSWCKQCSSSYDADIMHTGHTLKFGKQLSTDSILCFSWCWKLCFDFIASKMSWHHHYGSSNGKSDTLIIYIGNTSKLGKSLSPDGLLLPSFKTIYKTVHYVKLETNMSVHIYDIFFRGTHDRYKCIYVPH